MFRFRLVWLISTLLPTLVYAGRQQRDSVLYRIISLDADNMPVTLILDKISRENGIFFSYDAQLINNEGRQTLHFSQRSVLEILQAIFVEDHFHFLGKNNHIIISDREEIPSTPIHSDSLRAPPVFVLTGKVIDRETHDPLSYVNVSLLNRPIGTITNADGDFILKLPEENRNDTILISSLGYARQKRVAGKLQREEIIALQPVSVKIREVRVRAISPSEILANLRKNIKLNYSDENQLLTGFYRETVKQDDEYINISEAVMEILKAPYESLTREDKVHLLKARRSPEVQPFHWVNFKLQGGPHTITMLDVVKRMESFLDPEYESIYHYSVQQVIWYKNHPVFVVRFKPLKNVETYCFEGEMYIDRESYALLYARFSLDEYGLEMAEESLIMKKPKGFRVKPQYVDYRIDYSEFNGKWHLHTARASIAFKVKSQKDKVNSVFYSVSDLLVTNVEDTWLRRFPVKDLFTIKDVFPEMVMEYDETFWENYNIIRPDEDLQNAVKKFIPAKNLDMPKSDSK